MKWYCNIAIAAVVSVVSSTLSSAQEQTIRPAKVAEITATDATISRRYPALVLPSREIELSFKVSGQVIDLPIRAASNVEAGDVIAQIDKRDYENQLSALQSQRDQAVAQLDALRAGAREEEIVALEAAVESAQAQVDQTREALARVEELLSRGVSTLAQVEGAQAEFRVAEANLRAQQEQLRIGQVGGRPEEIAASEAAIRGIDAQIKVAQDALADTTLIAPFDGIIARRDIENFSNVQAGQSIVLLQGLGVVHLAFDIPGPDVTELTRNGPDQVSNTAFFDALPGQEFSTELVEFSVQADSATQTYRGRVAVEVPEGAVILPGMVANVVASTEGAGMQVIAPLSAIASKPDGEPFVWLVDDKGVVLERAVELGEANGASIVITNGLSEGDVVVAAGVSEIQSGMTIRPIREVGN
ncbi:MULTISPECIES: efflux RND transporter periplasmic adaptor subunit [Rhodobacterales]|uniref:Efflux RND transporter periplasmic adaptor subunit n=1 Tax=Parasulfitobacter algicola TaxID=2614809 RepID=A0ABX2IRN1_9RHOB|nr:MULTISPECIES: efflux RND transporter periplasmic adaptor subunit [Rhodobacterales]NSX55548.1 efflux RND transporter periplasmic adaptor subunit [Sulfitobacter algicola]